MESFEEDRLHIHELIGLPYKTEGHFHDMKDIQKSKYSTQDWTEIYFRNVTKEMKQELRAIYKYDFELFDYDPFLF